MSDQIEPDADVTPPEPPAEGTWTDSVNEFDAAADWLTPADRPQVKALYSIARQLDAGTFQAALISQFTLVHARLMAKRPGATGKPPAQSEADAVLEMFESNPGARWQG